MVAVKELLAARAAGTEADLSVVSLIGSYDNLGEAEPGWNRPSTIYGLTIVFLVLMWACMSLRLYTRLWVLRCPWWDDLFVAVVLCSSTLGTICICLGPKYGMGKHVVTLEYSDLMTYLKLFYIANGTYQMSTIAVKLSLLFQYLRIVPSGTKPHIRRLCLWTMGVTIACGVVAFFMAWFPCFPVSAYWSWETAVADPDSAMCYGYGALSPTAFFNTFTAHAGINMIIDLVVFSIPIVIYFEDETKEKTRMGLLGLLSVSVCVNLFSIWRLISIVRHRAATSPTFDPTWYAPISILLGALEVDVAGICASIPVFWPVVSAQMDQIFVTKEFFVEHSRRFSSIDLQNGGGSVGTAFSDRGATRRGGKDDRVNVFEDEYELKGSHTCESWPRHPTRSASEAGSQRDDSCKRQTISLTAQMDLHCLSEASNHDSRGRRKNDTLAADSTNPAKAVQMRLDEVSTEVLVNEQKLTSET